MPITGYRQSKVAHSDCGGDLRACEADSYGHGTPPASSQEKVRLAHPGAFVKSLPEAHDVGYS